jgi:hypothetical protein
MLASTVGVSLLQNVSWFLEQAIEWVSKDCGFSIKEAEYIASTGEKCVITIQKDPISI